MMRIDPTKIWSGPPQRFCAAVEEMPPVHGRAGWTLAKYEWRPDGTGRFLYVRNTGERREVIRAQKGWL